MPQSRSVFEVGQKIFKILNVTDVTDLIDGEIYREKSTLNNDLKNIVINTLPISDGYGVQMQEGIFFVNIFTLDLSNGIPDLESLKTISDAVVEELESFTDATENFSFEILSQDVMNDQVHKLLSYLSLRIQYFIENGRSF